MDNTLSIQVNVALSELFGFTISPWNLHLWMDGVVAAECSPWPPQVGVSRYRRKGPDGLWHAYLLTALEDEKVFELTSVDGHFVRRFTYTDLGSGVSEIACEERSGEGVIAHPLSMDALYRLKHALEDAPL